MAFDFKIMNLVWEDWSSFLFSEHERLNRSLDLSFSWRFSSSNSVALPCVSL